MGSGSWGAASPSSTSHGSKFQASCARDFVLWGARLSVGHLHRQHLDTARKTQAPFGFALPRTAVSPFQRPGLLT